MKIKRLKNVFVLCMTLVIMTLLTSCRSVRYVERVSPSGYLSLEKGQTFKAPRKMYLAEEFVIRRQQDQIFDLIEALRRAEAKANLTTGN